MHGTDNLELRIFCNTAMNALGNFVIDEHPGKAADFQKIATAGHFLGQIVNLHFTHLGKINGDAIGARFGDNAVKRHHHNFGIAGLLHHPIQGIGRRRIDDDGVVALQYQVLDLRGLLSHLVFRSRERISRSNNAIDNSLLGHLVPAFQHGLTP